MDLVNSYVNHSLNSSKTKAAFSFPREPRLKDDNKKYKITNIQHQSFFL